MTDKYLHGSEDYKITETDKRRYQSQKKQKRTKVVLSQEEVVKFAELRAMNASYGEYEMKLNLGMGDVEIQKEELGLEEMEDAKAFLKALKRGDKDSPEYQKALGEKVEPTEPEKEEVREIRHESPRVNYKDITDYTAKTSKRFRMTKDQKGRGLSRDQAFQEIYGGV